jgi:hypothetical protein
MPQPDKPLTLQTTFDPETTSAFFSFLAYGILTAIQRGLVPPETGIWTIGRPQFWQALEHHPAISPEVLAILQEADEWAALQALNPIAYETTLARCLETLEAELQKSDLPAWWNTITRQ